MINELTIAVTIAAAALGAIAAALTHPIATRNRWTYVPRYACGATIIILAFSLVLFAAFPVETAVGVLFCLLAIVGATGLTTWLMHDRDHQKEVNEIVAQSEKMNRKIHSELEK